MLMLPPAKKSNVELSSVWFLTPARKSGRFFGPAKDPPAKLLAGGS